MTNSGKGTYLHKKRSGMEKFVITNPVMSITDPNELWLEPDTYPVLRHMDDKRIIIYTTPEGSADLEFVVIAKNKGKLIRGTKTSEAKTPSNS